MFAGMAVTSALVAAQFGARAVEDNPGGIVATVNSAYLVLLVTSGLALVVTVAVALRSRQSS